MPEARIIVSTIMLTSKHLSDIGGAEMLIWQRDTRRRSNESNASKSRGERRHVYNVAAKARLNSYRRQLKKSGNTINRKKISCWKRKNGGVIRARHQSIAEIERRNNHHFGVKFITAAVYNQ